jgi:hypothetical protein
MLVTIYQATPSSAKEIKASKTSEMFAAIYKAYPQNKFHLQMFRCSSAFMMVHICAEFVGPLGRHRHHLQTTEPRLCIVLCVYNVQENRDARRM